jgi:hypothetical protein
MLSMSFDDLHSFVKLYLHLTVYTLLTYLNSFVHKFANLK